MIKLADLGIPTAADHTRITRSGVALGTASYMAPEQLEGDRVAPATDVYALATVAFEMLAGRKARTGRTPMEVAYAITNRPPPDLREAWQEAPAEAAGVVITAMARDPADRPASVCEFASEWRVLWARRPRPAFVWTRLPRGTRGVVTKAVVRATRARAAPGRRASRSRPTRAAQPRAPASTGRASAC